MKRCQNCGAPLKSCCDYCGYDLRPSHTEALLALADLLPTDILRRDHLEKLLRYDITGYGGLR